jgi:hypothetical protein
MSMIGQIWQLSSRPLISRKVHWWAAPPAEAKLTLHHSKAGYRETPKPRPGKSEVRFWANCRQSFPYVKEQQIISRFPQKPLCSHIRKVNSSL